MSADSTTKITIHFVDPDLDPEERNEASQRLLSQMKQLDEVESVSPVLDPNPPEGNKALGGFLAGVLSTEVRPGNLQSVFGFLGDRLSHKPIELEVEFEGRKIKLKSSSPEEMAALVTMAQQLVSGQFSGQPIETVGATLAVTAKPHAPATPAVGEQPFVPTHPPIHPVLEPVERSTHSPQPVTVFFSYSHKDESLRDELATHLAMLKRQGLIAAWYDRDISAGTEWAGAIDENLNKAQVILLLISANFLASDYCFDIELQRAIERHNAGSARVIPIILKPCDWSGAPFGKLQALPKNAKPVTTWSNQDEALTNVAQGIRAAVLQVK